MINGNATDRKTAQRILALGLLIAVYFGLLSGDYRVPLLSDGTGFPEVRFIMVLGCLLTWLLLIRKDPDSNNFGRTRPSSIYLAAVGLFFTYMATTSFWSPPGASVTGFYGDAIYILAFTFLGMRAAVSMGEDDWKYFWYTVVLVGTVFAAAGLASGASGAGRMAAFGGGPNVFVRIVGFGALAAVYLSVRSGKLIWLLPVGILSTAAILSGSRGGALALGLGMILFIFVGYRWLRRQRRLWSSIVGSVVAAAAVVAVYGEAIAEVVQQRFVDQLLEGGETAGRDRLYAAGFDLWEQAMLAGNGIGSFAIRYGQGFSYTHNIVLDILVDGGIIGLLLTLPVAWIVARATATNGDTLGVCALLIIGLFIVAASQFSGTYYDTRFAWFFLGLAVVYAERTSRESIRCTSQSKG